MPIVPIIPKYRPEMGTTISGIKAQRRPPMGKPELTGDLATVARMWPDYSVQQIAKALNEGHGYIKPGPWNCRAVWNAKATIDSFKREAEKD